MAHELDGIKVAILATDGVEQSEFSEPKRALEDAGAGVDVISINGSFRAVKHDDNGDTFEADVLLEEADADEYDALVLPGGVKNPDRLRQDPKAVDFVRSFFEDDKPVAAICHGPWLLAEADVLGGKHVTSYSSIRTDLVNAGAIWADRQTVVDGKLLTSRKPDDLEAFCREMLTLFRSGKDASEQALAAKGASGSRGGAEQSTQVR